MLKVLPTKSEMCQDFELSLDEIAREGARRLLTQALNMEVEEYIQQNKSKVDENGRCLVVRNGVSQSRKVTFGSGTVEIQAPRINDRREGEKFSSSILPPYLRKSPKVESLLPILYLKGLSTNDFKSALSEFLGEGTMGLSPASIVKLKKIWEVEFDTWTKRKITKKYVYIWADGVNVQVRLGEDKKICLLVIIGASEDGNKELLAVHPGYRESAESWLTVLHSLVDRGLTAPRLAIGDGALGFWAALRTCHGFEKTEEQRCWVHKIANALDKRFCNFNQTRLNKLVLSLQLKGENSASLSHWSIPYAALGSMLPTGGIGGYEKANEIPNGNCLALPFSIFQVPFELETSG